MESLTSSTNSSEGVNAGPGVLPPPELVEGRHSVGSMISDTSLLSGSEKTSWENSSNCTICGVPLGKRHLIPRHHCRVCNRSICAKCSPNQVQLVGQTAQRACNACIATVERGPEFVLRLQSLGRRLQLLINHTTNTNSQSCYNERQDSLEEALVMCERAMQPLESEASRHFVAHQRVEQLENEKRTARSSCIRIVQRIHALHRPNTRPAAELQTASLNEVTAMCEAALAQLEDHKRRSWVDVRRMVSDDLDRRSEDSSVTCSTATPPVVGIGEVGYRTPLRDVEQARSPFAAPAVAEAGEGCCARALEGFRRRCCSCNRWKVILCLVFLLVIAAFSFLVYTLLQSAKLKIVFSTEDDVHWFSIGVHFLRTSALVV